MSISFGVSTWLALLICLLVLALVTYFYVKLQTHPIWLKHALIIIRSLYTLALLFIILDAAVMTRQDLKARVLILGTESPTLEFPAAPEGQTRRSAIEQVIKRLVNSPRLSGSFSIEAADAHAAVISGQPAAVVNVIDTSSRAIAGASKLAAISTAPLFIIAATADKNSPDVSVNSVDSDGIAHLDIPVIIHVTLYGRGMAGRSTLVKLVDEAIVVSSTTVEWKAEAESISAPLVLAPRVAGPRRYTVTAEPVEGEVNSQNNGLSFSVDVERGERRILFFEDQPTWEGKFLRRALESNGSIAVDYVAKVSRSAFVVQRQADDTGSLQSVLSDFEKLARYDAIIAGPTDAASLTKQAARNINDFVERRGGGLILLGGNDFNGSILAPASPVAHLSPAIVSLSRRVPSIKDENQPSDRASAGGQKAFLVPTEDGKSHPIFWLTSTIAPVERLGPLSDSYLRIASLKRGASALAVDGSKAGSGASVMIAAQDYGNGRTLLLAPADLWKLGLAEREENEGAFALLWQNIALWAAGNAEPAVDLRLATAAIEAGDQLRAYAAIRDEAFNAAANLTLKAALELENTQGEVKTTGLPVTITPSERAAGVYEISAQCNTEGKGTLSLSVTSQQTGEEVRRVVFYVHKNLADWREQPDAYDKLAEIARATGGKLYQPDQTDLLESELESLKPQQQSFTVAYRLRNSAALAFILPLLMAAEYFLRKRYRID